LVTAAEHLVTSTFTSTFTATSMAQLLLPAVIGLQMT